MSQPQIKAASTPGEIQGIKLLQQRNLKAALTPEEAKSEGFVTAEYTLQFLQEMNEVSPSIIAVDGETIVGYALATTRAIGIQHDLLRDLFKAIDSIIYGSRLLKDANYIVIGQICVAKGYRGIGLSQKLYQEFRNTYSGWFDYGITDVAEDNTGSLAAHVKSGFKVIDKLPYGGVVWNIVLWDWNSSSASV